MIHRDGSITGPLFDLSERRQDLLDYKRRYRSIGVGGRVGRKTRRAPKVCRSENRCPVQRIPKDKPAVVISGMASLHPGEYDLSNPPDLPREQIKRAPHHMSDDAHRGLTAPDASSAPALSTMHTHSR